MAKSKTNETNETNELVNPFDSGVTYKDFIKALDGKTPSEYLSGKDKIPGEKFTDADINWLTQELSDNSFNDEHKAENEARSKKEHNNLMKENK